MPSAKLQALYEAIHAVQSDDAAHDQFTVRGKGELNRVAKNTSRALARLDAGDEEANEGGESHA